MRNLYLAICFFFFSFFCPLFIQAQQLAPSIVWQKCLGGSGEDKAYAMVQAHNGGFVIVGSSKSNDGDVSGHHGAVTVTDAWVVKISASGVLEWQKSFGGTGADVFNAVIATADGGYLCSGTTESPNDGDVSGSHGKRDLWLVKIDRYGNLLWQNCLGGLQREFAGNISENSDSSIYVIGSTESNDLSGYHGRGYDILVAKLSSTGSIRWQRCFGGSIGDEGYSIIESSPNDFIIGASVPSDDGDFGTTTGYDPRGYLIKIDANTKTMIWKTLAVQGKPFQFIKTSPQKYYVHNLLQGCGPYNRPGIRHAILTDPGTAEGRLNTMVEYMFCNVTPDLNGYSTEGAGLGILNATNNVLVGITDDSVNNADPFPGRDRDGFMVGYTTSGSRSWKKLMGGSAEDVILGVTVLNEFEFVVAGYTASNNGDVSGNHGNYDFWVVKLGRVNRIVGTVFGDYNSNGVKDTNEPFLNNVLVQSKKGPSLSASSTNQGVFGHTVDTGTYSTGIVTPVPYYTFVPATSGTTFAGYNLKDSVSFALQPIPGKRDYRVQLYISGAVRPGFEVTGSLQYANTGTDTLTNKTIRLVKDGRLQFMNAVPAPGSINGDTLTWTISTLLPRDVNAIQLKWKSLASTLKIGDTLISEAFIDTTADLDKANNLSIERRRVTGSFDPNDKQETHDGVMYKHEYDSGDYLTYTIRFQNTGTDTAFTVVVKDTLSSRLDSNTLEMIGSSHPYTFVMKDGRYCTWTFGNILLPDSNVNEPLSHGYITFRIKPKSGLLMHDAILNSASIYFDFNEPVKTNTVETALKPTPATLPPQPAVTGMQRSYCKNLPAQKGKITNLPATSTGITVTVDLDDEPVSLAADSTFTFTVSTLSPGQHVIQVMYMNSAGSKVTPLVFTIVAAVTPDVNVSASTTNVTNLATPVVVAADNAAGGGTDPLYTFAKDRGFATILQAEGSSNTLTIDPHNLTIGNNWVYVRMKTGETCVTTQTNTDSINVRRDQTTGIVDIDNPAQIINVYPNPFKAPITISGLNAQKKYIVTITSLQGQQVYSRKVNNRSTIELPAIHGTSGVYWLTLYDATRQRSLGSVKLIKE